MLPECRNLKCPVAVKSIASGYGYDSRSGGAEALFHRASHLHIILMPAGPVSYIWRPSQGGQEDGAGATKCRFAIVIIAADYGSCAGLARCRRTMMAARARSCLRVRAGG